MAHSSPELRWTPDEKELLSLLAQLVADPTRESSNFRSEREVVLSDREADRLVDLLQQFSASRKFQDGSYFVELLFGGLEFDEPVAREIYLSWRKRHGRTRALASTHWQEFLVRIGLSTDTGGYLRGTYGIQARRMDLSYFLKLEAILLRSASLDPRLVGLISRILEAHRTAIESVRSGENKIAAGNIRNLPQNVALEVKSNRGSVGVEPMSTLKAASLMLLVADVSVLFTTRDWNVVGTLSSMSSAVISLTYEP